MTAPLALRNIVRDRRNSLAVTLLIAVIAFLFFAGNSLLARTGTGLRASYVESLTGDFIVEKKGAVTMSLFGANAPVVDEYFAIPPLPAYGLVADILRESGSVAGFAGQVSTRAAARHGGRQFPVLVAGVDGDEYFPLFPGIRLVEGRFLRSGESGVMLSDETARRFAAEAGVPLRPGDPVTFTAAGRAGFRIREAPLRGIFAYRSPGRFMNGVALLDAQTARALAEIQVAGGGAAVSAAASALLDAPGDALFWDTPPEAAAPSPAAAPPPAAAPEAAAAGGDAGGDWNFIVARLKPGVNATLFTRRLDALLEPYGATALSWRFAAGGAAIMPLLLAALFNGGMTLVSAAGIIAVVNIMLIAVFRRSREIGTLRALGASGAYIRRLILGENALLGAAAGLLAAGLGALFVRLVNAARVPLNNEILANLAGGGVLRLDFSPALCAAAFAVALAVAVLSALYPVETAVRVEPSAAQRRL